MKQTKRPSDDICGWNWSWQFAEQLPDLCIPWQIYPFKDIRLLWLNIPLARELGLDPDALQSPKGLRTLLGDFGSASIKSLATPVAQAYAGHQFGHYNPRLGDGRALLLGEHSPPEGSPVDIHLKGSGPTPFSRGGDGFAALGPMLREAIMGEALHHAGIPSSRALAVFTTGEHVHRQEPQKGALLVRVAKSHIRVGSFQYASNQAHQAKDLTLLSALRDFTIARHYPALFELEPQRRDVALFNSVIQAQAQLVAQWMAYGFIHGVMNTDNMTLSGETIDFGPCAMLEHYSPQAVFSSIDHQGRYAYGQQPHMALWNLARLGESLLPLLLDSLHGSKSRAIETLNACLSQFQAQYEAHYYPLMQKRLGLPQNLSLRDTQDYVDNYLSELAASQEDYTLSLYRHQPGAPRLLYIPRNHLVEAALQQAHTNNLSNLENLLVKLRAPYSQATNLDYLSQPASAAFTAQYQTFCGT